MRFIRSAVAAALLAAPINSVAAQVNAEDSRTPWSFSLGADPLNFDLRTRDPGVNARVVSTLTRSWQAANPALKLHMSVMLGADAPRGFAGLDEGYSVDISRRYAGVTTGASYELFRKSRFSPYFIAGAGIYRDVLRSDVRCEAASCPSALILAPRYDKTSLGLNGGLGVNVRLGSRRIFVEQRLHAFDINRLDRGIHPLSIGFRF